MGGIRLASNDIREVVGRCVMVTFEIVDKRPMDADVTAKLDGAAGRAPMNEGNSKEEQQSEAEAVEMGGNKRRRGDRSYDVSLSLGSNILDPLLTATYGAPGVYTVEFELPRPMLANVVRCFTALPLLLHRFNSSGERSTKLRTPWSTVRRCRGGPILRRWHRFNNPFHCVT